MVGDIGLGLKLGLVFPGGALEAVQRLSPPIDCLIGGLIDGWRFGLVVTR